MSHAAVMSAPDQRTQLRRAVVASTVGTAIEWYDFFLYGSAAAVVFPTLFFPNSDPLVSVLQSFAVYAVGFVARPIGAAIFGNYGDRMGRKSALIATLLLMGIATFLVAFVPGYSRIGIWGGVCLVALRFIQGIGVGGEWGGSVLLSMEWARTNQRRGLIASWPQFGVPSGLFLANVVFLAFSAISGSQFSDWGWRVPFILSIVLVAVGLYIRLGILETPIFARLEAENRIEPAPLLEVLRRNPKEIVLAAFARLSEQAPFYIFTVFVLTYGTKALGANKNLVLSGILLAAAFEFVLIPYFGHLSDRIGRRRMYLFGAATMGAFGFLYFALLDTRSAPLIVLAIVLSLVPHAMQYGPQASLIAENFTGRIRYSGASVGYQLASVIAGGPAPLIAAKLFGVYQSGYAISLYILACAVLSLIAASLLGDYTGKDISAEYDAIPAGAV